MPRLWIDTVVQSTIAVGGSTVLSLMTGVSSTQSRFDQMTLLRTIIGLDIGRQVYDSGEGSEIVSLGIGIASQEAFAAQVLADPFTSTDFPTRGWIWRGVYRVFGFAADQPAVFTRRIDLDLRSQRKLENGEAYINMQMSSLEGAPSISQVVGLVRQLWLVG